MKSFNNINHWLSWAGMLPSKNLNGVMVDNIHPEVIATLTSLLGESPIQVYESNYDSLYQWANDRSYNGNVPNRNLYESVCTVNHNDFGWCEVGKYMYPDSASHTYYNVLLGGSELGNPYEIVIKT